MKSIYFFDNLRKTFFVFILLFIILFTNFSNSQAIQMNNQDEIIVEELRLNIPSQYVETWIKAEKEIWEPWLSNQEGFLGRKIFYNKEKEGALLLVNWKSRELWKNITFEEVNKVQNIFEKKVKTSLAIDSNPFELIYEGELFEQK